MRERRSREVAGAFLVEGPRSLDLALRRGARPIVLAYSPELAERHPRVAALLRSLPPGIPRLELSPRALESVADTVTTQGVLAAFELPRGPLPALDPGAGLVLALDRVQDPGNVGTLIRSAAAAGADAVLLSPDCADPYAPKVTRASAGAVLAVQVRVVAWDELVARLVAFPRRYAAEAAGGVAYDRAELAGGCVILVGNEGAGLGPDALALATDAVRIPLEPGFDSLNAAVAGSILLFEARRQRANARRRG